MHLECKKLAIQHINFISITSKLSCCVSWSGRKIQKQILSIATYTFNTCESVCYCILIRGQKTKVRSFCRIKICFLFQRLSERIICLYLKASNLLLNWLYFLFTIRQSINCWNTLYFLLQYECYTANLKFIILFIQLIIVRIYS